MTYADLTRTSIDTYANHEPIGALTLDDLKRGLAAMQEAGLIQSEITYDPFTIRYMESLRPNDITQQSESGREGLPHNDCSGVEPEIERREANDR